MKMNIVMSAFIMLLFFSCQEHGSDVGKQSPEELKSNLMKINFNRFIEALNNKDLLAFRQVSIENCIRNLNGITVARHQNEMEANINVFFNGFPDAKVTTDEVSTSNNLLFAQWTLSGTNTGNFGDYQPTGKKVNISGCSSLQFNEQGKIVREDVYYNELELLQQLGYTLNPPVLK
ncbi:MAG: ester cyclase [Maribacter sp.]|nr:ester cyclase [Maribacter sp.]